MAIDLELIDKRLLNVIQSSFPLEEYPFDQLGETLGISGQEVVQRIRSLKRRNIVRQISAIFDTRRLGYKTTLVAVRLPPDLLEKGARIINRHPGVSHNYGRTGQFNLWFTLAVPPNESLEQTVQEMAAKTGAEAIRIMPTLRFFKIGVNFDMITEVNSSAEYYSPDGYGNGNQDWNKAEQVTPFEVQAIRELQEDLPLERCPFKGMAERLGVSQKELFALAQDLQRRGIMRRFSAVLHHRRAGFSSNAMIVWRVPPGRSEEVGRIMASFPAVSHCYERPTFSDWPYTHFTMIHATSKKACERVAHDISAKTGIDDYQPIYSTREYKKIRVRYFV